MQRSSTSYRPMDAYVINVREQQQPQPQPQPQQLQGRQSPTKRMDDLEEIPIYDPRSTAGRRSRPWPGKWIHVIPVMILLAFFILWWFSYPVRVEMKHDGLLAIHSAGKTGYFNNDTQVDITILASATSPIASVLQNLTRNNETVAFAVSPDLDDLQRTYIGNDVNRLF